MMEHKRESSTGAVGKSTLAEVPAVGKRTLVEQAYNQPLAPPQQVAELPSEQPAPPPIPRPPSEVMGTHASNAPAETYIIPFDRNPKSLPGEQIIFGAVFTDPKPNDYQLVYTCSGGDFNSAGSGTTSLTISFHIHSKWDKKSAVTVKMMLQRVSDKSAVRTETWTFTAKTAIPTTVTQQEAETERTIPSVYSYKAGPDRNKDGRDDYIGVTVLEKFQSNTSNLTVADVKPAYAKLHGLTTDQLVTNHFFGADAGHNGTFTVSEGDMFYDQHGGGMPDKATFEAALVRMKEIYVDLPQTYEAEPGKALGQYTVRRILKTDGSKKLKKSKHT